MRKNILITAYMLITSIIVIPFLCINLGLKGDFFTITLSRTAGNGHYFDLLLIGTLASIFYLVTFIYLRRKVGNESKFLKITIIVGCILFELTVIIPLRPSQYPILSIAHTILAYISISLLLLTIAVFTHQLRHYNQKFFIIMMIIYVVLYLIGIGIFILFNGANAFYETYLMVVCCLFMCSIDLCLYRVKHTI